MNLLKKSLTVHPDGAAASFGHAFLLIIAGLMIFYIHGLHKLEGWIAYLLHGTPWSLAEEVAYIGFDNESRHYGDVMGLGRAVEETARNIFPRARWMADTLNAINREGRRS